MKILNWYRLFRFSQIYGEYWITSEGNALYADGDVGDYNHESHVIETILNSHDLEMDIHAPDFIETYARLNWAEVTNLMIVSGLISEDQRQSALSDMSSFIDIAINNLSTGDVLSLVGLSDEEVGIALGGDARLFAMKNWGWKRLESKNVETWGLSSQDMHLIASGLWDAYGEDVENKFFNIYSEASKKWYRDISYDDISEGNMLALQKSLFRGW